MNTISSNNFKINKSYPYKNISSPVKNNSLSFKGGEGSLGSLMSLIHGVETVKSIIEFGHSRQLYKEILTTLDSGTPSEVKTGLLGVRKLLKAKQYGVLDLMNRNSLKKIIEKTPEALVTKIPHNDIEYRNLAKDVTKDMLYKHSFSPATTSLFLGLGSVKNKPYDEFMIKTLNNVLFNKDLAPYKELEPGFVDSVLRGTRYLGPEVGAKNKVANEVFLNTLTVTPNLNKGLDLREKAFNYFENIPGKDFNNDVKLGLLNAVGNLHIGAEDINRATEIQRKKLLTEYPAKFNYGKDPVVDKYLEETFEFINKTHPTLSIKYG